MALYCAFSFYFSACFQRNFCLINTIISWSWRMTEFLPSLLLLQWCNSLMIIPIDLWPCAHQKLYQIPEFLNWNWILLFNVPTTPLYNCICLIWNFDVFLLPNLNEHNSFVNSTNGSSWVALDLATNNNTYCIIHTKNLTDGPQCPSRTQSRFV